MAVIVEGMEMPRKCGCCPFQNFMECDVDDHDVQTACFNKERDKACKLIEVPEPHGRLGDLDAPISLIDTRGEKVEVTVAHIIEKNRGTVKAVIPKRRRV